MAIYNTSNGNSPAGLKVGDYSVTSNGQVYQVLDSSKYKNMSSDQLKSHGVSYNPATGYYSKQVTGKAANSIKNQFTASQVADSARYQNKDTLNQWKDAYIQSQLAGLQQNFNTNKANLLKTYNKNYSDLYGQIGSAENANKKNIQDLYDQTYLNNAMAIQQAANRGITSAAQGVAMGTSGLMSASKQAAQLTADKDQLVHNIQLKLNDLTANYNIDKDMLDANFNANKLATMSTADLQWLQQALDIDNQNNTTWNNFYNNELQNQYNTAEREAEQAYKTAEADNDVERQKALLAWQYENDPSYKAYSRSGGGYGGYGGYSYGGYGGYGGGSRYTKHGKSNSYGSSNVSEGAADWYTTIANSGAYTSGQLETIWSMLEGGATIAQAAAWLNKQIGKSETYGPSVPKTNNSANKISSSKLIVPNSKYKKADSSNYTGLAGLMMNGTTGKKKKNTSTSKNSSKKSSNKFTLSDALGNLKKIL